MKPITIAVDELDGLRAFAAEWLGFDPWAVGVQQTPGIWHHMETVVPVLPLNVPAGFALGVALGRHHRAAWANYFDASDPTTRIAIDALMALIIDDDAVFSDLADLLGEYRNDDTNPTRAAEALRACLLALPREAS